MTYRTESPRRLEVGRWTLNAVVAGSGRPVLFLHGLGMSLEWWRPAIAELSHENLVCAIDLPAVGDASTSIPAIRQACGELVSGVIDRLDAGPALVVGHSLGGFVAANAAILGAPGIGGMFLVAPGGFGQIKHPLLRLLSFPVAGELMIRTGNLGSRIFLRSVLYEPRTLPPEIWKLAEAPFSERLSFLRQVRMGMRFGRTTAAYRVEAERPPAVPTGLVWGRHDPVHPPADMERARTVLGARDTTLFERSGHLPQLEEPRLFYSTLRAFASKLWAPV